jgi:hypothetical protein
MNTQKIIYWIATVLLCGIMLYSASMYFAKTEMVRGFFEHLNHPSYIVIPLAIAKVLGVIIVLSRKIKWLMEWAYAGMFFDMLLAFAAHQHADDGAYMLSLLGIGFLLVSYFLGKSVRT